MEPSQGSDSRTEAVSKQAGQSTAAAELGLGDPGWATCTIAHARGDWMPGQSALRLGPRFTVALPTAV